MIEGFFVCLFHRIGKGEVADHEFEFTGLSNFDFLATDFANEEAAIHEEAGGLR